MQDGSVMLNAASQAQIQVIGDEQTPVMIFDDFASNSNQLIEHACQHGNFSQDSNSYYPGIRASLPIHYVITALQSVYQQVCELYKIPLKLKLKVQPCFYSLLTCPPQNLSLLQCFPHFDTSNTFYFAVLHYLNPNPHGNTGFFRHNQTGFERINTDRVEKYLAAANDYVQQIGEPEAAYFISSNSQYELYHQIEYKPNRLVIYPGNMLHSTIVCADKDIDADPRTGRLTANLFIDFK